MILAASFPNPTFRRRPRDSHDLRVPLIHTASTPSYDAPKSFLRPTSKPSFNIQPLIAHRRHSRPSKPDA